MKKNAQKTRSMAEDFFNMTTSNLYNEKIHKTNAETDYLNNVNK